MTAFGQYLKLRLFLEGVEVPVVSASIQSQKNAAAVAALQIPANDYAMELRPRTLVHLFAYDAYRGAPPQSQVWVQGAGINVSPRSIKDPEAGSGLPDTSEKATVEQDITDLENENYKLIFGGELIGVQYAKTPQSRGITLQCLDWSSYWDIAYQYMLSGFSLGGGGIRAAFTGASTTVFNDFLEGSGDIVLKLMETAPRSYPSLKGTLLGAMVHIIEAIGGVYFGKRAVRGTNDFFSLAEMRLHLTQQIGANPFGAEDEKRLMRANGFGSLFSKALGGLGKLVTVRQVFMALQRYIFHEVVPITAPRYIPPVTDPNTPQFETVPLGSDKETAPLVKAAQTLRQRALELQDRQQKSTSGEAAKQQSNRRGGLQMELLKLSQVASDAQTKDKKVGIQGGDWSPLGDFFGIAEVAKAFETAARQFITLHGLARKGATGLWEFPLSSTATASQIDQVLQSIADGMQLVVDAKHRRRVQRTTSQPDPPPRLLTQIYRPDVWMVAPPRCNVLFPELYSSFSYGRNFQQEVSRLLLRTHSAFFGSDILFDGFYMAPSRILGARTGKKIGRGRVGIDPPDLADAPAWAVKDLMDHELFTGIVPVFERMSDLNLHAIRGGSIEINGAKVGYAQLAANHIFFQYRFKSRELLLSGKFNPYIALGFPAVVVDKYLAEEAIRNSEYDSAVASRMADSIKEGNTKLPSADQQQQLTEQNAAAVNQLTADLLAKLPNTHYLGTPELISHSLSASQGGQTQVQMGYARTTNEKTEFLGDNIGTTAKAKRIKNANVPTVVAALEPPQVGTRGYLGGKITEVKDVTDAYQPKQPKAKGRTATGQKRFASTTVLPLFVASRQFTGRQRRGTRVPVGVEQAAAAYGPEVVALVGSGGNAVTATAGQTEVLVSFRAFRIVEEIGTYATKDVELPPEELVFPPWYGESYRTSRIGGLYSYFFGIGAITDPTVILGAAKPKTFGDGEEARTLYLQLEQKQGTRVGSVIQGAGAISRADQLPQPGANATPSVAGGGQIGPAGESSEADSVLGQVNASPISTAIEEVVKAYSACRLQNFDTPQFVQNYTWRPIASMVDLFGTAALQIDDNGLVTTGREGFHSRAFGDYDDLRQLVGPGDGVRPQRILGLTTAPKEIADDKEANDTKIAARLDTRREKRLAVYRYLYAIAAARGVILG
ncbi:MAG TPA: hypothetical protein VEB21_10945 [Terriglobales bacterium]|nr:hypothetical protein [Terriglobales bacterium]